MHQASFDELAVGDRVKHTTCGDGVVVAKGETVDVQYDHIGKHGRHWSGKYDHDWFRNAQARLYKLPT